MTIDVRPLLLDEPDEDAAFDLLVKVDVAAFSNEADPEELKAERGVTELDRAILAWDGKEPVGCTSVYSLDLSVPGGSVPTSGVTWVGVSPTHRRRGVMSAMLDSVHAAVRDNGKEPVSALWASQPPIYGRFGYGVASRHLWVTVQRAHGSRSMAPRDRSLRLRLVDPADDAEWTLPVYRSVRRQRPGLPELDDRWQARCVSDPKSEREGASPLRTVLVEDDDGVRAFARYAFKHNWSGGYGDGTINVRHLLADHPAAEAELWRYLIDLDLASTVDVWNLPVDSPIQTWLDQPRHNKQQATDALYIKLIDLQEALQRRTYTQPIDLVFEVTDQGCPWNEGRWRLAGDESGATCSRTADAADVSLDVKLLGAAYLGGTALNDLSAAGWITENTSGAVKHASGAFSHYPSAFSPFVF